jgi:hypothetical protein
MFSSSGGSSFLLLVAIEGPRVKEGVLPEMVSLWHLNH